MENGKIEYIAVSLSPQTIASISVKIGIDFPTTFRLLSNWLKSLGVSFVCNAAAGGDIALIEAREE